MELIGSCHAHLAVQAMMRVPTRSTCSCSCRMLYSSLSDGASLSASFTCAYDGDSPRHAQLHADPSPMCHYAL